MRYEWDIKAMMKGYMKKTTLKISEIKNNPNNPRLIKDDKFKKLVKSLKELPIMLEKRPVIIDENNVIIGGNMRHKAAKEAGLKELPVEIFTREDAERNNIEAKKLDPNYIEKTYEEQVKEMVIKDNVSGGEWDYDVLANEWDATSLSEWGVDIPTRKNTDLLSTLEYSSVYYEPSEKPTMTLADCVDLTVYNKKMKALEELKLSKDLIETLRVFAYRFIKIDFESVANYYAFNATEDEKLAIERLRLVLTDDGVDGFIEDDLLRILDITGEDVEW